MPRAGAATRPGAAPAAPRRAAAAPARKLSLARRRRAARRLDGIGPTLAKRIVEYRDEHGGFRSVDELSEVEGIGEKRLATLREALQP